MTHIWSKVYHRKKYCIESRLGRLRLATRCAMVLFLAFIVISSYVVIFMNMALLSATGNAIDSSDDHATVSSSFTRSMRETSPYPTVRTPTIQGPLQIPRTLQSTDLVNSLAFYEVTFITSTTGAIDKIRMDFPAGTGVGAAGVIERVGIGGGILLKSGSSITYDVTSPVSIPAGTFIRLEMFGIKNPINPSTAFTATITTRDSGGNLIDGPSQTNVYTIKKVGSSDLADGSVTSTKPAESFIKEVLLLDNAAGNAGGWNPNGVTTDFLIFEPALTCPVVSGSNCSYISMAVLQFSNVNHLCDYVALDISNSMFRIKCSTAPGEGDILQYVVVTLPAHVP